MSIHNIGFNGELTKIIFQLSSNTHLISSSAVVQQKKYGAYLMIFVDNSKIIFVKSS